MRPQQFRRAAAAPAACEGGFLLVGLLLLLVFTLWIYIYDTYILYKLLSGNSTPEERHYFSLSMLLDIVS
jgi:hypothetical protein